MKPAALNFQEHYGNTEGRCILVEMPLQSCFINELANFWGSAS